MVNKLQYDKSYVAGCKNMVSAMFDRTVVDITKDLSDKDEAISFINSDERLGYWANLIGFNLKSIRRGLLGRIRDESNGKTIKKSCKPRDTYRWVDRNGKLRDWPASKWAKHLEITIGAFASRFRNFGLSEKTFQYGRIKRKIVKPGNQIRFL